MVCGLGFGFFLVGVSFSKSDGVAVVVDGVDADADADTLLALVSCGSEAGVLFLSNPLAVDLDLEVSARSFSGDFSGGSFSTGSKSPKKFPARFAVSSLDDEHPIVCSSQKDC